MKIKALTHLILASIYSVVFGQDTLTMPVTGNGGIYNTCYAAIYDNGGPDSNYANYSNSTLTIAPLWVQEVSLYFEVFDTEIFFDSLSIYDGPGTTFPLIGTYSGNSLNGQTVGSSGSSITLLFRSDDIQTGAGFKAWVSCLMGNEILTDGQTSFVYPNPATSVISIKGIDDDQINEVYITDITGRNVLHKSKFISMDVSTLIPGIYHLHVVLSTGQLQHFRWLKQ